MIEPMKILYRYAEEHMVYGLLEQERKYADARQCAEKSAQSLRALVGEAHEDELEAWMDEQNLLVFFHGQALFRAGFQIALELTR